MWKIILVICLFIHCALSSHVSGSVSFRCTKTKVASIAFAVVYDKDTNSIYYVDHGADSQEHCIFRYDIEKKKTYSAYIRGPSLGSPGSIIPNGCSDKLCTFTIGFRATVLVVAWDSKSNKASIVDEIYGPDRINGPDLGPLERIYVGHRDPTGSAFYAGTIGYPYCGVAANQSVIVKRKGSNQQRVLTNLNSAFGFGFANCEVYIMDPCQRKLWAIPDPDAKCHGKRDDKEYVVIDFAKHDKHIDDFFLTGLEADSKGNLFAANYYDGTIYKIDPIARKFKKVAKLPVQGILSLTFGEDNGHGQTMYASLSTRIRDFSNFDLLSTGKPGCAIYKIEGLGSGETFDRLKV